MAYNNREWDRGKDSWNEGYSGWSGNDHKNHVRPREEDYTGDPKRRKFNDGGYQGYSGNQGYDDSGYGGGQGHGHGRHQDYNNNQDHGYDDRPRGGGGGGGFTKKRIAPSEPSPHVIFLGLDPDFTEADLQAYLTAQGCALETVTIIRDRSSGVSKGFGFAQFTSTEHAQEFVDPLFPFIQMPPPASHGASARNAFYQALEQGAPHNGKRVKIDYSQSASPHERGRPKPNANDGTRDIGNTQCAVLLFRGLDPLSGPQAIHQAMLSSNGPSKQGAKGMKRIILIKDKVTMASFCFAFVEFVDVESASAVLAASMSPQLHPNGFRISDKPVAASFAHPYSFQPVTDFLHRDEACLVGSQSLGGVDGSWVRYWDETSSVAVLEFKVEEPAKASASQEKKKEKKKVKETKSAAPVPSALPLSDKPVMLSLSKGPLKIGIGASTAKTLSTGVSLDDAPPESDDTGPEPNKPKPVQRVAALPTSKKTANIINKWNQMQGELHGGAPSQETPVVVAATPALSEPVIAPIQKSAEPSPAPEDEFEFSDTAALMCLLCSRQFKSLDQLKRHNKESDLHKKNYKDPNLREVARQKAAARKAGTSQTPKDKEDQQPKYRDRASERRTFFNQPDVPLPDKDASTSSSTATATAVTAKKRYADGPAKPPTPPPPPARPAEDENNVGNKLLKMMGWKEGTGLGTDGEGRVDPVETAFYAQGAGLGASKGKDISKLTEGYGYLQMAQEAARERYGD